MVSRIINAIIVRFKKLCNTFYVLINHRNIIVVNAPLFQFINRVRHYNVGDDLNFYLIKELSGKKVIAYKAFYHRPVKNIMMIGSIIDWLGNKQSIVWGSGILVPPSPEELKPNYILKSVLAVRGKKTRECLINSGYYCPEIFGDPALLTPLVFNPTVERVKGRIGFIPHYKELKNKNLHRLLHDCGDNAILIKVQDYISWKDFIIQILSCEFVISSSLHGLILSDAYGIPNQWVSFTDLLEGGRFKYEDYYSAVLKDAFEIKVTDTMTLSELIMYKVNYKQITFDPIPLLKACPFKINHSGVLELMEGK